jgi:hypothetical protein
MITRWLEAGLNPHATLLETPVFAVFFCCQPAAVRRKSLLSKWLPDMDSNHDEELAS